jgi:hypothetical protein
MLQVLGAVDAGKRTGIEVTLVAYGAVSFF